MTKERFLDIRATNSIKDEELFEFYRERGGRIQDYSEFFQILQQLANSGRPVVCHQGVVKRLTWQSILDNFVKYYSKQYGI